MRGVPNEIKDGKKFCRRGDHWVLLDLRHWTRTHTGWDSECRDCKNRRRREYSAMSNDGASPLNFVHWHPALMQFLYPCGSVTPAHLVTAKGKFIEGIK